MSDRPIKPESQLIAGPSRSNDDALVNDSRDDTDVSRIIEPLAREEVQITYRQTKLESFYKFYIYDNDHDNEHDDRSMNVVRS